MRGSFYSGGEMVKEKVLEAKKATVQEIREKLESAQSLVLVDYKGLNVSEVTDLRKKCRDAGVEYKVYKNTMLRFALHEIGIEGLDNYLEGTNAVAFGYEDPAAAARIVNNFAKDNNKLEIKVGLVDKDIFNIDQVKQLASLPTKEVLIAKVLGGFNAPLQGFANVLNGTIKGLVVALGQIAEKKQSEA